MRVLSVLEQSVSILLRWAGENPTVLAWLFGLSLALFLGSLVLIPILISRMRPDYFVTPNAESHTWLGRHPVSRSIARLLKNALGAVLLFAGLVMMVLPGQGIITLLVALSLLEFPGKRSLELRLIRQQHVSSAINWTRSKAGQPPLMIPTDPGK